MTIPTTLTPTLPPTALNQTDLTQTAIARTTKKEAMPTQLALELGCNVAEQTVLQKCYMAYPLSVSSLFRRENDSLKEDQSKRAYLYRVNTSPALLARDSIGVRIQLAPGSQLYLADQSATKVHRMPDLDAQATVDYSVNLDAGSTLEFLPEPLILFADSALRQTTDITMHPDAGLCWGEVVLPGRLTRGEVYQFRRYLNKTTIRLPDGRLRFAETMNLTGKENRFVQSPLFANAPVLGTLVLVLPRVIATTAALKTLSEQVDAIAHESAQKATSLNLASSVLPDGQGLFIRVMAKTTREIQSCFRQSVDCVRSLREQNPLPYRL
ncbi:urease accessory protein UreD [cf. Phormidesmis sp. LEGE 11477]|uniref:urease accessory protein UreD n=1 Tax=cf. Phormidesmis sp. LEGE 11477 TaxID=1828680 RepID=UPI001882E6A8|nr:urease accessory protein UreD [cf. Phormidesmis sp. LEGE 11477]MBE9060385.1 urease accessory protein UreD [cf. Phormidesmis sp. LEGE 11477]